MKEQGTRDRRVGNPQIRTREDADVQEFLDRFARALTAGDGATIAGMWLTPSYVLADEMEKTVGTQVDLQEFFAGAREQYNSRGITDTRAEIYDLQWLTPRICLAHVRWPYLDAGGREIGEESSTYTLRRGDDGELKICVTVMHGASA